MSVMLRALLCLALAAPAFAAPAFAAEPTAAPTAPALREVSPGIFQVGPIRIDQQRGTATFPAKVNQTEGALEYLLVTTHGATHESLLSTEVQPADLHFSMLLLGAKGAGLATPAPSDAPPSQIDQSYLSRAPKLQGDRIQIAARWRAGDAEKTIPVEDWIFNAVTKAPAPRGPWIYTGSMFRGDHFLAQAEGAFAALVTYPAALINNPRKGNENDSVWTVNTKAVPAVDTPIEVVITLEQAPKPAAKK